MADHINGTRDENERICKAAEAVELMTRIYDTPQLIVLVALVLGYRMENRVQVDLASKLMRDTMRGLVGHPELRPRRTQ